MSLRSRIRSHIHRPKEKKSEGRKHFHFEDNEFYDIGDDISNTSEDQSSRRLRRRQQNETGRVDSSEFDKTVFEEQLNLLQEQLVAVMVENQSLSHQLEKYESSGKRERRKDSKDGHFKKSPRTPVRRNEERTETPAVQEQQIKVLPPESKTDEKKTRIDLFVERTIERFYNVIEDFTEITQPENPKVEVEPQLAVKRLKENIRRFLTAIKPYRDTLTGLNNLMTWRSPSYTIIVMCIYMFIVWRGWFLPFLIFLAVVRIAVNYLHFKNFNFRFSYLDPGAVKESEDVTRGLSDKFNLVLQVATKVQNGLGTTADSLEKIKNLLTWRHHEATRRLFSALCFLLTISAILPTSIFWTFLGLGFGVKIFLVNPIYARYPRIKKRYDTNAKLWASLPTDAQYNKSFVTGEMNKYIVIPNSPGEQEEVLLQPSLSDTDSDDDESCKSVEFRELFSLPPTECPLTGWMHGRRAVLVGRDRSVINLISKKRGKLYLTNSFLCFVRDKTPSPRNIVIPLQDVITVDRVKVTQRLPGKGMAIQVVMTNEGFNKVLIFGGIIGRDEVASAIERAIETVHNLTQTGVPVGRPLSTESSASQISNFSFGPFYEDTDSMSD